MSKITKLLLLMLLAFGFNGIAQQAELTGPNRSGFMSNPIIVPSIAEQIRNGTFIPADNDNPREARPKKRVGPNLPPGKGANNIKPDGALQTNPATRDSREPFLVFDADTTPQAGVTDPTGAVGPNHYMAAWNFGFRIFDKEGNPLTNEASLATLFPGNAIGDPIFFFDPYIDNGPGEPRGRFVVTEFDNNPNGINIAVCQGPDPVNDGWFVYTTGFQTGQFPDYTKFSVWSDAYYVTANINNTFGPNNLDKVFALEREQMAEGLPAQFIAFPLPGQSTFNFFSPHGFNVTGGSEPLPGNFPIVYMQDERFANVTQDHLDIWTVNVDWDDTSNSTISAPQEIGVPDIEEFIAVFDNGAFGNLTQPNGVDVDALQLTIMNRAHFRMFDGYNSAIFNFVVDTDPTGGELAGIRWYELRQTAQGEPWSVFQEGTYIAPDGRHAFSGSMVMDVYGNIGMGYTSLSTTESVSIRTTGRLNGDTPNEMTIAEGLIQQSTSNSPGERLADYVQLSIDPEDDRTFWHIAEYFRPNRRDVVGVFDLAVLPDNDVATIDLTPNSGTLTDNEIVSVTIKNYGTETQTSIPVSYQVDGGDLVEEVWEGSLAAGESVVYEFDQLADLSAPGALFRIETRTSLANDDNSFNDIYGENVENDSTLSLDDLNINNAELLITSTDNRNFNIEVNSNYSDLLGIQVYDLTGKLLTSNFMPNVGNKFRYQLDMSYVASGVYLVKVGEKEFEKSTKIIVK